MGEERRGEETLTVLVRSICLLLYCTVLRPVQYVWYNIFLPPAFQIDLRDRSLHFSLFAFLALPVRSASLLPRGPRAAVGLLRWGRWEKRRGVRYER